MTRHDLDYYRKRERQERECAIRTEDTIARRLHLEMAERYSRLLGDIAPNAARLSA